MPTSHQNVFRKLEASHRVFVPAVQLVHSHTPYGILGFYDVVFGIPSGYVMHCSDVWRTLFGFFCS